MDLDRELIVRAQRGDAAAERELVARLAPLVFRLASRFFQAREDVEDLAQEALIRFFARISRVRPEDNVAGWVRRITINVCYDRLRKLRREKTAFEAYRARPAAAAPEAEVYETVRRAVDALDPRLRVPLLLKEIEGLSIQEIAAAMGISAANVKIRLFRARKKLATVLEPPRRMLIGGASAPFGRPAPFGVGEGGEVEEGRP